MEQLEAELVGTGWEIGRRRLHHFHNRHHRQPAKCSPLLGVVLAARVQAPTEVP
jgi:hypothetical protein